MSAILDRLHQDHKNASLLLDMLDREMAKTADEERPDYPLLVDVMQYMTGYPDAFHHPTEELLFQRLRERDVLVDAVLKAVESQHRDIASAGRELLDSLQLIESESWVPREVLQSQVHNFVRLYREHMDLEEGKIFPLAKTLLDEEDWKRVDAAMMDAEDPLFGTKRRREFLRLHDYLRPDR